MDVATTNEYITSLMSETDTASTEENVNSMGKEEFLEMFTKQLQYQDPLNPMDNTEFTAQLATFSSLEQLTNINDGIQEMIQYENSLNNIFGVNMIGKSVTTEDGATGVITGITFEDGVSYLSLDSGEKVMMSELTSIYNGTTSST